MRRHTLSLFAALSMLALTSPALAQNVLSVNAAPSAAGGTTYSLPIQTMLAFAALYAVLAGYLTGMLFAAKGIRQDNYR